MMRPLWQLTATELADAFSAGSSTPEEAVEAVLLRCSDINPKINAVVTLDADGARRAAATSTRRWAEGRPLGRLDGVPVTIKDNILVGGMRATWGSRAFADFVPEQDETPVARLRAAGAVVLGKTNVPEFTVHGTTDNALFGPTRNPWDLTTTPGGSSGGGAAAVAAGIGPVALCTDGGGSIRRPAAHCGVVGFKPSSGVVPRQNGFPAFLGDFEVAGPIARSVADVRAFMEIVGAPDRSHEMPKAEGSRSILHVRSFGGSPVDPIIEAGVERAASNLRSLGHRVDTIASFDLADPVGEIWSVISQSGIAWLCKRSAIGMDLVGAPIREMVERGRQLNAIDYVTALNAIVTMKHSFDRLFDEVDFLLTPAIAAPAWAVGVSYPERIDGKPVGPRGHAVFTAFANALGIPAISLPCALDSTGSRIGFQLCSRCGSDREILDLAAAYENAFDPPILAEL